MAEPSTCVDDDALFALARGQLFGAELERVEGHLRDCADCRAVLAEAARSLEGGPESATSGESPTRIARYQIVSLIGAGAAGVVYRAFDPQLKRTVALKVMRAELHAALPAQSERMLREAQSMARLSDPHVVALYDVGLHQGSLYLVLEYIDGSTLSQWLRGERRSLAAILRVFGDAGRGLAAAHHKGLVHRDFKLENVLVARDGRAYVTDFGLARESENWLLDRQADDQASTELYAATRGLIGTPAYMAPELFEGGRATPASDQFALCVALFVALFDQHPFRAGQGIALSELVTRVRAGTLETPALVSASHERLFAVLERGLAPEPARRFADVAALLSALERARLGSRRGGWWLALAAVLLVLAGAALLVAQPTRSAAQSPSWPASAGLTEVNVAASAQALVTPVLSAAPSAAASGTGAPNAERRRGAPKPGNVRYKDWLKDPF